MQEEVTQGAVTLIVNGSKLTEQAFEKAVKKFLEKVQKSKQPKIYRGKQTLKQRAGQNAGLSNIEISDKNIKAFSQVAKKYHVDFALKKDTAAEQPRYLVFFKSRDADAITAAFQKEKYHHVRLKVDGAEAVSERIASPEDAQAVRAHALKDAEPDGFLMPFAENYRYLKQPLEEEKQNHLTERIIELGETKERRQCEKSRPAVFAVLTDREYEIVGLMMLRLSNREIAEKLFLTEGSVKQYLNQIYAKLHLDGDSRTKRQLLISLQNDNP